MKLIILSTPFIGLTEENIHSKMEFVVKNMYLSLNSMREHWEMLLLIWIQ